MAPKTFKKKWWFLQQDRHTKKMIEELKDGRWPSRQMKELLAKFQKPLFKWEWGGKEAKEEIMMMIPFTHVLYRQTDTEECHTRDDCIDLMNALQDYDMEERGLLDLQYNFYIGGDGIVYEGRGYHVVSTKDAGYEHLEGKCVDIAYIGDFPDNKVPQKYIDKREEFVDFLVNVGYLTDKYYVIHLGETERVEGINYTPRDDRWDDDYPKGDFD